MHKNLKMHLTLPLSIGQKRFDPKVKWIARWWMETLTLLKDLQMVTQQ